MFYIVRGGTRSSLKTYIGTSKLIDRNTFPDVINNHAWELGPENYVVLTVPDTWRRNVSDWSQMFFMCDASCTEPTETFQLCSSSKCVWCLSYIILSWKRTEFHIFSAWTVHPKISICACHHNNIACTMAPKFIYSNCFAKIKMFASFRKQVVPVIQNRICEIWNG